jgi:hypothetical protein
LLQAKFDFLGIHRLQDPRYCLDVAWCDFGLFESVNMKLEAMSFPAPVAMTSEVQEILDEIWITEWVKVFHE